MDALKSLVDVFGPGGGLAVVGCFFLWRHIVYLTKELVALAKTSASAINSVAATKEKEDR